MKMLLKKKKLNILKNYNIMQDLNQGDDYNSNSSFINNEKESSSRNLKGNLKIESNKEKSSNNDKKNFKVSKENVYENDLDIIDIITNKEKNSKNKSNVVHEENMFENIFENMNKEVISNKLDKNLIVSLNLKEKPFLKKTNIISESSVIDNSLLNKSITNEAKNLIMNVMNKEINHNMFNNSVEEILNNSKLSNFLKEKEKDQSKYPETELNSESKKNILKNSMLEDILNTSNFNKSIFDNKICSSEIKSIIVSENREGQANKNYNSNSNNDLKENSTLNSKKVGNAIAKDDVLTKMNKSINILSEQNNPVSDIRPIFDEKFNQMISYLDEKNKYSNNDNDLNTSSQRNNAKTTKVSPCTNPETLNMAVELKECKKTIETMKIIIEELRKDNKLKDEHFNLTINEKVNTLKYEYENTMKNNSMLIESLINEKTKLLDEKIKIEEQLSNNEKEYNKKLISMMENFDLERKKDKEAWYTAEKARKKKWEEQKIRDIKENTIKGLEPEIEKILQNHKSELFELEEKLVEELKKQREKLINQHELKISELREKYTKEKEESVENEKSMFSQRMRSQNERFENEHNEERRRWSSNLNAEISRIELLREKDKKQYDDDLRKNEDRFKKILEERDSYYKGKMGEIESRLIEKNKIEIDDIKLKLKKEKELFIDEKQKEYDIKYNNMKLEINKDKEKQLELIINKLGDETIMERRKIQVECENKADSINRTLKIENEQIKQKINELNEKLSAESKVRLMLDDTLDELSKKVASFEKDNFYKDKKIMELTSTYNDLQLRFNSIHIDSEKKKNYIENEYQIKLEKSKQEIKLLNEKNEALKNYYEGKIIENKNNYDYQINIIDTKVKKKLDSREEIISQLQDDLHMKEVAIQKYEELLAKQRKELLMNG